MLLIWFLRLFGYSADATCRCLSATQINKLHSLITGHWKCSRLQCRCERWMSNVITFNNYKGCPIAQKRRSTVANIKISYVSVALCLPAFVTQTYDFDNK